MVVILELRLKGNYCLYNNIAILWILRELICAVLPSFGFCCGYFT